jgi:hypothetical protein
MQMVHKICEGIRVLRGLQSFMLRVGGDGGVWLAEVRHIVQQQLSDIPGLNFVDICGAAVRLVDGEWMDVQD